MIDVEGFEVVDSIAVGTGPHGVVVDESGMRAYTTNVVDDTLSTVDLVAGSTVGTVRVGAAPNGVSYWYGDGAMP